MMAAQGQLTAVFASELIPPVRQGPASASLDGMTATVMDLASAMPARVRVVIAVYAEIILIILFTADSI
ncbi:MAG: hypothetical protein Q8P40_13840 [Nitrospirota bacterium]|nr:hypothetical protein [Nitrospirota bacterium]